MNNDTSSPTIMVVDDEEVIRYTLQKKLSRLHYNVISLERAEDALYLIKNGEQPDLVITDIKLRKMDGIELLRRIHGRDEQIPVLIITGHGNVEDAIRALRYGAIDFIRKPFDMNDVAASVRLILKRKQEKKIAENFAQYLDYWKGRYVLPIDPGIINSLSYQLTRGLVPSGLCNYTTGENISLALQEAISNAMFHGSLGIASDIREEKGIKGFNEEVESRRDDPRYADRTVRIEYELNREFVEYVIEDDGKGFDYRSVPNPRDPKNFLKDSGRGLLIIQIHLDEVEWNSKGNRIRLRKYRVSNINE